MKHFTILEIGAESPMIGTIDNIPNNEQGIESFKVRFLNAIGEHFDTDDFNYDPIPDLFSNYINENILIEIDGFNYEIQILETWMY